MANQALDGSDQNGDLSDEHYQALKKAGEIIEQQNAKLKHRISQANKKRAKQNNSTRIMLIRERKKLEAVLELLKEEEEDEDESEDLFEKEGDEIDEFREARKLLIDGLKDVESSNHHHVRVKRMGNLEPTPFYNAVKRGGKNKEEALHIALNKCALWAEHISDPSWHPFKAVSVDGESVEMIDESDKKLKLLRLEMGVKVYEAVAKALREMSEYNPISRKPVSELWNFRESRKATLKEGIVAILNLAEQRKRTKSAVTVAL